MVFESNRLMEVSKTKINFTVPSWRNGSAPDSRSEGCVFKSRRGHCCVDSYNEEWYIKWHRFYFIFIILEHIFHNFSASETR